MILIIGLGVLTTALGVAFGCTVLELTMRALEHSLNENTQRAFRYTRDCFAIGDLLGKKERRAEDALDNFRHTVGSVVARVGKQLHVRWVHSCAARDRAGGACLPVAVGQASGAVEASRAITVLNRRSARD